MPFNLWVNSNSLIYFLKLIRLRVNTNEAFISLLLHTIYYFHDNYTLTNTFSLTPTCAIYLRLNSQS